MYKVLFPSARLAGELHRKRQTLCDILYPKIKQRQHPQTQIWDGSYWGLVDENHTDVMIFSVWSWHTVRYCVRCCHVLLGGHFEINQIISGLSQTVVICWRWWLMTQVKCFIQTYAGLITFQYCCHKKRKKRKAHCASATIFNFCLLMFVCGTIWLALIYLFKNEV